MWSKSSRFPVVNKPSLRTVRHTTPLSSNRSMTAFVISVDCHETPISLSQRTCQSGHVSLFYCTREATGRVGVLFPFQGCAIQHYYFSAAVIWKIFIVKKFSYSSKITKIKHTKYFQCTYYVIERELNYCRV